MRLVSIFFVTWLLTGCLWGSEYSGACDVYESLNDKGDPYGSHALGECYLSGKGRVKNIAKAIELFIRASEAGRPEAKHDLASLYLFTVKDESKYTLSIEMLRDTAEAGVIESHLSLGIATYKGLGTKKNVTAAIRHFQQAATNGNHNAMLIQFIGYCYGKIGFQVQKALCFDATEKLLSANHFESKQDLFHALGQSIETSTIAKYLLSPDEIHYFRELWSVSR